MLLTQKENQDAQSQCRAFIALSNEYRALLEANGLPFSVSLEVLLAELRNQQFAKLLTVDAGLKMRFEMLRTEEAQQKLVAETVNLDGYDIVGQLRSYIQRLGLAYGSVMVKSGAFFIVPQNEVPLSVLATSYNMDLCKLLDERTINWEGSEHIRDYFLELAKTLQHARAVMRALHDTSAGLGSALNRLGAYFTAESNSGDVEINEQVIVERLAALKASGLIPSKAS